MTTLTRSIDEEPLVDLQTVAPLLLTSPAPSRSHHELLVDAHLQTLLGGLNATEWS